MSTPSSRRMSFSSPLQRPRSSSSPVQRPRSSSNNLDTYSNLATKDLFRLNRRTIAITGGHGVLGMTLAASLLEQGADVICLDAVDEKSNLDLFHVVFYKANKYGGNAWFYHDVDVTHQQKLNEVIDFAMSRARYPLRGLVCCAGISGEYAAESYPKKKMERIMEVNFLGCVYAAQGGYRWMRRQGVSGSVVLVGSVSGRIANRDLDTSVYNASKAAVQQLARNLAMEWSGREKDGPSLPPIRVNSLSPGHIRTPMLDGAFDKRGEKKLADVNMLGRVSEAIEYRAPVLFLLGDGSSFVTASDLVVDGGQTAW